MGVAVSDEPAYELSLVARREAFRLTGVMVFASQGRLQLPSGIEVTAQQNRRVIVFLRKLFNGIDHVRQLVDVVVALKNFECHQPPLRESLPPRPAGYALGAPFDVPCPNRA